MGRPRKYATDAERQRACRQRQEGSTVRVERRVLEGPYARLEQLQAAIWEAAAAGDEMARACSAASVDTMVENMIRYFGASQGVGAANANGSRGSGAREERGSKKRDR
jgi:hypothetical protein